MNLTPFLEPAGGGDGRVRRQVEAAALLNDDCVAVLDRLLELTKAKRLIWESDPEDDFFAPLADGERVVICRLWMEVVGRPGADPYQPELRMPGWSVRFPLAGDSDGCRR